MKTNSRRVEGSVKSTSGKTALVVMIALVVGALLAAFLVYRGRAQKKPEPVAQVAAEKKGGMTEEERIAYLAEHVEVRNLVLGPDTKPGTDEAVPGLQRVSGVITNRGDRPLERANLSIYLQDDKLEVIGSYVENVVSKTPLEPGATRRFHFVIPQKKGASGTFEHKLH